MPWSKAAIWGAPQSAAGGSAITVPGLPFLRDFGVVRPGCGFALTFAAISVSLCPLTPQLFSTHDVTLGNSNRAGRGQAWLSLAGANQATSRRRRHFLLAEIAKHALRKAGLRAACLWQLA